MTIEERAHKVVEQIAGLGEQPFALQEGVVG